jgi:plasmid stabilization system protein ParE
MAIIYHRLIKRDLRAALAYYDAEGGSRLGDRFFEEVEATVARVSVNPQGCHFVAVGLRRAALNSFPYHFLYEEDGSRVWFLVFRHDRQHPHFGLSRRKPPR